MAAASGGLIASVTIATIADGPLWFAWRDWFIGDAMGVLVIAPVLLFADPPRRGQGAARNGEFVLIFAALATVVGSVFGLANRESVVVLELGYLALPIMMWAAIRLDVRRTAILGAGVGLATTWLTAQNRGPFALSQGNQRDPLVAVQIFVATMSLSAVLMSRVVARSRDAEARAHRQEQEILELGVANEVARLEAELHRGRRLESVGRLAGGIAHDFNNLLGVILNYSAALRRSAEVSTGTYRDADQIFSAAQRGSDLTRQLLLYSRSEAAPPVMTDIESVVQGITSMLQGTMSVGIELDVVTHGSAWSLVDRSRVEQALVNLVLNARDAIDHDAPGQPGKITVSLDSVDEVHVLTVSDDGCGMTPEVLAQATEPFFTTKPPGKGSGLGLATAYATAAEFGGRIDLRSEVGHGTTVSWEMPCAPSVDASGADPTALDDAEGVR